MNTDTVLYIYVYIFIHMYGIYMSMHSRTPEIETVDLSQSHASLNLSQSQTDFLLRISPSTAILNYFKLFENICILTTLTNEKYWYFTLLKTFINLYAMHSLFLYQ